MEATHQKRRVTCLVRIVSRAKQTARLASSCFINGFSQCYSRSSSFLVHCRSRSPNHVRSLYFVDLFVSKIISCFDFIRGFFKANKKKSISQFQRSFNLSDQFDSSGRHLRALCRLYFADFLCGGYTLPVVCQSIINEASDSVEELKHNIMCASMPSKCK